MIPAILIGRKGSKAFPGKNLYPIFSRPMTYYPMKAALDCPDVDEVYISTDDERLVELAETNGVEIIKRPQELCTDEALGEDVYVHAYNYAREKLRGQEIELLVLLMCNAVMITKETIANGIKVLRENPDYDSAITVSQYNMWSPLRARRIDENGLLKPFVPLEILGSKRLSSDRNSQGGVWFADMGASIVRPRCLENIEKGLLPQRWMGQKIYPLKQKGGFDVDFEWEIPLVEHWLREHGYGENRTEF